MYRTECTEAARNCAKYYKQLISVAYLRSGHCCRCRYLFAANPRARASLRKFALFSRCLYPGWNSESDWLSNCLTPISTLIPTLISTLNLLALPWFHLEFLKLASCADPFRTSALFGILPRNKSRPHWREWSATASYLKIYEAEKFFKKFHRNFLKFFCHFSQFSNFFRNF